MMMHNKKYIAFIAIAFVLAGCAVANQGSKVSKEAELSYSSGDYSKALQICESTIEAQKEAGKNANGQTFNLAGLAAFHLEQVDKAEDYLQKAVVLSGENEDTYYSLASIYIKKDNLSKEISNLEYYKEKYPSGTKISKVNSQLFSAYVRSENWELGDSLWVSLDSSTRENPSVLSNYLIIKRKLNMDDECEAIANKILISDKSNVVALEFFADKYYNRADESYVKEMKAYEKNQTMKQYNRLTAKLKEVNKDFKMARDYYEKLYKINPDKRYAKNLGNIYTRFENKQKAKYYYNLSK